MKILSLIFILLLNVMPSRKSKTKITLYNILIKPIVKGISVLKVKPQFFNYVMMYFVGGVGLIGIHSVLPQYFKNNLKISYTELALAFSFCKGVAFIATSPFWAKYVNRTTLFIINSAVNLFSCFFLAFVIASHTGVAFLYIAYLCYGVMQAGCQLSWNMSGAVFSDNEDNSFYTSIYLAFVGIRGLIVSSLGYLLFRRL